TNAPATDIAAFALDVLDGRVEPDTAAALPDVLICTHGARDVCCGGAGMKFATEFASAHPELVVWRTSHLGGHRFAPTALTLPDGNLWAYCDEPLLAGILDRSVDVGSAAAHHRGCSAAPTAAQLVERAALLAEGWPLLDCTRMTGVDARSKDDGGGHDAWCEVRRPDGTGARYAGRVTVNRVVHVPPCGGTDLTDKARDYRLDNLTITPLA
ncbi:MAG: sucrase ferredoxin, partial [Acidimicrobiales bacterium]